MMIIIIVELMKQISPCPALFLPLPIVPPHFAFNSPTIWVVWETESPNLLTILEHFQYATKLYIQSHSLL